MPPPSARGLTPAGSMEPGSSAEVREHLVEALNLDLIGPWADHVHAGERLPGWVRPSNWYLTGFLIPSGTDPERSADADEDDDLDETPASGGLAEESAEERRAAKKGFFPSSMGLSFLVAREADALAVIVRWGDYERAEAGGCGRKDRAGLAAGGPTNARYGVPLSRTGAPPEEHPEGHPVPDSNGLRLHVVRTAHQYRGAHGDPGGGRARCRCSWVNRRRPGQGRPGPRLCLPGRDRGPRRTRLRAPAQPARRAGRGLGRAGGRSPLRGHSRVRHRSRCLRGLGGGGRRLPEAVYRVDSRAPTSRRRRRWRCPASSFRWTRSGHCRTGGPRRRRYGRLWISTAPGSHRGAKTSRRLWAHGTRRPTPPPVSGEGRSRCTRSPSEHDTIPPRSSCAGPASPRTGWSAGIAMLASDAAALDAFRVANRAVARALRQRFPRTLRRWSAPLARLPARLHPAERPRPHGSARSRPRDRGPALLPHRRRQDGGVPRPRGLRDGAAPAAPPGTERPPGRRRERHHAVHAAPAHPGPARPRVRPGLRAGAGTRGRRRCALR